MTNGTVSAPATVVCSDPQALSLDAAYRFVALSAAAVKGRSRFSVALAGGRTPARLYSLLASDQFRGAIEWDRVHIFFGDERAVPLDSQYSNYRMATEALVSKVEIPASNVYRIHAEQPDPGVAAEEYQQEIASYVHGSTLPRFDLVLLGMGSDGHCASLFPGSAALEESSRWVVQAEPGLEPFVKRVTITLPVINNAANVLFLVEGADKATMAARVLGGDSTIPNLPAQRVAPTDGILTWLLDRAAANKLTQSS